MCKYVMINLKTLEDMNNSSQNIHFQNVAPQNGKLQLTS